MQLTCPARRDADEWQIFLWDLPEDFLSRPQKLQLMLMLEAGFNAFDPYVVVRALREHRPLWTGVVMDRAFLCPDPRLPSWTHLRGDLIKLRDIGHGHWNVDALFILTSPEHEARWEKIITSWRADEHHFHRGDGVGMVLGAYGPGEQRVILTVWWD
jgi:hypothetical protein